MLDDVLRDVEAAVEGIRSGVGRPDVEHRLQSALLPDPDQPSPLCDALGLTYASREFPAWRGVADHPTGGPGLIDFLAIDSNRRLHVVETKANHDDPKIVLQALDYGLWVQANLDRVRKHPKFALADDAFPILDFVCAPRAPGLPAVGQYMSGQLDALAHEQRSWRVWIVDDPENPRPLGGRTGQLPKGPLVCPPAISERRWSFEARKALGRQNQRPESLFLPRALPIYHELLKRRLAHKYVLKKYSSQALCLNLFAELPYQVMIPLCKEHLYVSLRRFNKMEFEFEDPDDRLGERRAGHRHQTQIDVALRGETVDGRRWIGLMECKFTEGFSSCSGYVDPANDDRDACRSSGPFGAGPSRCFKVKAHPGEQRVGRVRLGGGVPLSGRLGSAGQIGKFAMLPDGPISRRTSPSVTSLRQI